MTISKKYLSEPPYGQEISNRNLPWVQWFNDLHYRLGSRNHQTITAAKEVNLDARYVALKANSGSYVITLSPPVSSGETKVIELTEKSSTYEVSLTLTNVMSEADSTTCTWSSVNDSLVMISLKDKWLIINDKGVNLS
jgi:hypothetical protein